MTASRLRTIVFVTGALLAGAIAQAQEPAQGAKPTAPVASSSVTTGSPAAVKTAADGKAARARSAGTAAAQSSADPSAQLIRDARNAGFKPQIVGGNQMFCRVAIELGSNFPVRTCYNGEQVKIKIHEYQAQRDQMEQQKFVPPACHPPTC